MWRLFAAMCAWVCVGFAVLAAELGDVHAFWLAAAGIGLCVAGYVGLRRAQ